MTLPGWPERERESAAVCKVATLHSSSSNNTTTTTRAAGRDTIENLRQGLFLAQHNTHNIPLPSITKVVLRNILVVDAVAYPVVAGHDYWGICDVGKLQIVTELNITFY